MEEAGHSMWSEYKWAILLGGASGLLVVYSIVLLVQSTQTVKPIEFRKTNDANKTSHIILSMQNEQATDSAVISINTASQFELELLPGVGPATAKKIMDHRPYGSVDELVTQKIMGEKLFEKLKNFLVL